MPPKKGGSGKKESDGKDDKGKDIEGLLLEKDLEIATLFDKLSRLEKRSQTLTNLTEMQQFAAKEMEEKLQDVISCLTSDVKDKELKINGLEVALGDLKAESTMTIDALTKDLNDLKNTHKFVTEDLRLQLANAQVQLRDIDDFRAKKTAIEQEVVGLKETIEEERKKHQDMISDIERAALQEKERLRKEMTIRIEETKIQMLQQMDEQLHAKTKRTMVENEQLGKELSFHIRQTESLLQKNEKLVEENIDLHRKVLLAKEVQEDLAHRNRMNQKTIRILLYKLRERHSATKAGKQADEEEMKRLLCRQEQLHSSQVTDKTDHHHLEGQVEGTAGEMVSRAEEAMKFLYACLEDIEIEEINNLSKHQPASRLETDSRLVPTSLDALNSQEREEALMFVPGMHPALVDKNSRDISKHLLWTAVSLRAICQNAAYSSRPEGLSYSVSNDKAGVSIDDILKLPVGTLCGNEKVIMKLKNHKFVSNSAQTESMDLEERLALDIKQRLRSCGSAGVGP